MSEERKATNPKDAIGATKVPFDMIPESALAEMAMSFLEGGLKYGRFNWRAEGVRASIYYSAMRRHMAKWYNGEDADKDTTVLHLASVMACCAIIIDAKLCGKLTDDRPPKAPVSGQIDELAKKVAHLKEMFKDHDPYQYTIADSDAPGMWDKEPEQTFDPEAIPPAFMEFSIKHMDKCESFKELERKYLEAVKEAQRDILGEFYKEDLGVPHSPTTDEGLANNPEFLSDGEVV